MITTTKIVIAIAILLLGGTGYHCRHDIGHGVRQIVNPSHSCGVR